MGCYIAPNYALTIEDVIAAIRRRPRGAKLLVADGFNVDLADPERTTCAYETAVEIAAAGLEDMINHFLPRHKPWLKVRMLKGWILQQNLGGT